MPHIRSKKYQAMEEKIKLYSEFMEKIDRLNDVYDQVRDEMKELKIKYEKNIEEQNIIIEEENKKEIVNVVNSPTQNLNISPTRDEIEETTAKRNKQDTVSVGYKCAYSHQPMLRDGTGRVNQEVQWNAYLGLWVDWRSELSPKYKTTMCQRGDDCKLGGRCCYAHSKEQLRPNYNIKTMIPIENYKRHKLEMEAKLKTGWDWEKELVFDRIIKE